MPRTNGKATAMDNDCVENRHMQCPGCSCSCHWDAVLVQHFAAQGRRQDIDLVNMRTCSSAGMSKKMGIGVAWKNLSGK